MLPVDYGKFADWPAPFSRRLICPLVPLAVLGGIGIKLARCRKPLGKPEFVMRIASLTLNNFKRFIGLEIGDLPKNAKLVLLVGANGSGKSSVFDAFNFLSAEAHNQRLPVITYDVKDAAQPLSIKAGFHHGGFINYQWAPGNPLPPQRFTSVTIPRFFGRSSLRVMPEIQRINNATTQIDRNLVLQQGSNWM